MSSHILLNLQELLQSAPACVVHLSEPGVAQELDEALAQLAFEYQGTRFLRTRAAAAPQLLRCAGLNPGAWLVAARHGRVMAAVPVAHAGAQLHHSAAGGGVSSLRRRAAMVQPGDESSDFSDDEGDGNVAGQDSASQVRLARVVCARHLSTRALRISCSDSFHLATARFVCGWRMQ